VEQAFLQTSRVSSPGLGKPGHFPNLKPDFALSKPKTPGLNTNPADQMPVLMPPQHNQSTAGRKNKKQTKTK